MKRFYWLLALSYVIQISTIVPKGLPIMTCEGTFAECQIIFNAIEKDLPQDIYWKYSKKAEWQNDSGVPGAIDRNFNRGEFNKQACGQDDCGKEAQ